MKNIFKYSAIAFMSASLFACTGDFDKINTDPDAFDSAPYTNMLGYMEEYAANQFGGDIDGYGTWAGYIVKIQYLDKMSGIIPTNNTYGNRWYYCYYANTQLQDVLDRTEAEADSYKNIRWVCKIWKNYCWAYLTDGWRDVPYTEAMKGGEGVLHPKYDKQEDIYPAILSALKTVADEMSTGFGSDKLGEGDFIYKGSMVKWQKFCNSLRLRLAMRISGVSSALAKSTVEEIFQNPSKYPVMESTDDQCYFWWQGSGDYRERWYDNMYGGRDDHGMSDIFINHMKNTKDPRIASIAHYAGHYSLASNSYVVYANEYTGFQNGPSKQPANLYSISRIGAMYRDDAKGFTPFMKASEVYYIKAEAAMLGYSVGSTAKEAYEMAVRLSMKENNVSDADADTYLTGAGKWDGTKDRIYWDEWVALFKNNFEAWCLYRRTGFPTTNYISLTSVWGDAHNTQPFRLPYPNNEYLYNADNVKAAAVNSVNYCWGQQMWWDTRTGVK